MKNDALFEYCLRLGDTSLILSQRLGEWCGHGPILEEDIALTNISLDLLGQARSFLTYAGETEGKGRNEDDLAFFRDEREFRNLLLAEQPNGDFGVTLLRQFLICTQQYFLYQELSNSKDSSLSALAARSFKETTYHLRHCSGWVQRLATGTEESRQRMLDALDSLWRYTGDMFDTDELEKGLIKSGIAPDTDLIRKKWDTRVREVFSEASLSIPENVFQITGSRQGRHTEHLGHLLAEMQVVPRSYPGAVW